MATQRDWVNTEAEPNGIGPVCRHCDVVVDWHPYDHACDCPEFRMGPKPQVERISTRRTSPMGLTTLEAAERLGVTTHTIRRMCQRDDLVCRKVGGTWYVSRQAVRELLDSDVWQAADAAGK